MSDVADEAYIMGIDEVSTGWYASRFLTPARCNRRPVVVLYSVRAMAVNAACSLYRVLGRAHGVRHVLVPNEPQGAAREAGVCWCVMVSLQVPCSVSAGQTPRH